MTGPHAQRPGIVTVMAVCQFLAVPLSALAAAGLFTLASGLNSGPARYAGGAAVAMGVIAILQVACGVGLWTVKSYGRTLQLLLGWMGMIAIPVGTVLGILIVMYLRKSGVQALFDGKPPADFSKEELRHLAPMGRESGVVAAAIAGAAVFGSFFCLSIVAAVAVPRLLMAKMKANELVGISTLRRLAAEETAYARGCGHGVFATSFEALSDPLASTEPDRTPTVGKVARIDSTEANGFAFMLKAGLGSNPGPPDCHGRPTVTAWYATAAPQVFGASARRAFAANAAAVVWGTEAAAAPTEPFGPPAVIIR